MNDFTIEDGVVKENTGLSLYNDKFVEYNSVMTSEEAAGKAIEYCIDNGVMADFFTRKKAECMGSILYDHDEKKIWKMIGDDYYQDGYDDGYDNGYGSGYDNGYGSGVKAEREQGIKVTIEICKECSLSSEEMIRKITEKFGLNEEEATEKVNKYKG